VRIELDGPPDPTPPSEAWLDRGWAVQAEDAGRRTEFWYDTPGFALLRWGVELARIDDELWRLCVPAQAGASVRSVEQRSALPDPPAGIMDVVRPLVRGWELQRVLTMEMTSRTWLLAREGQADSVRLTHEARRVLDGPGVGRWLGRYLIEGGDQALCQDVVELVRMPSASSGSVAVRVLGSAAQAPPDVQVPALGKRPTAADVLGMAVARDVHELLFRLAGVPLDEDQEDVHRARVATRRLRGILRTFAPLFRSEVMTALSEELAWLASELGPVRDADVMATRLGETSAFLVNDEVAAGDAVMALLANERESRWREAMEALRSSRCVALLDSLVAVAEEPPVTPAASAAGARTLTSYTRGHWRRLRRRARDAASSGSELDLHRTRLAAKRARYACETAALAVGEPAARLGAKVGGLQDVLGGHQDAVVLRDWLRQVARQHPELALGASELAGMEAARARDTADGWVAVWRRVDRKRLRRWMRG